jgi:PAP2 superfamily
MQTIPIKILFSITVLLLLVSCDKDIEERNENFRQLNPTNTDISNGGTWKTFLLTAPDEFALEVPLPTTDAAYKAEINEIKSYQANLSNEQKATIKYWSVGGVLRWNEIMRTLVARHNLPPYQNEAGVYTIPSPDNPFGETQFPFSNPPYAARAYAYVSAAQFDALVATWHYKKLYNRAAPYVNDTSFEVMVPKSTMPAYPAEDGVIVGVTVEILKAMFPTEIPYINQKAEEHKLYRIMCGANVRSDVEAGIGLGKKIATKFKAKAKNDGTGVAVGNQTIWNELEATIAATGQMPWKSLELPIRPPMLPKFGEVKSFLMTDSQKIANRPPAPPSTSSSAFAAELAEVKSFSESNDREKIRIVNYWADGVGTFTPPGHWNMLASEAFVEQNYSELRWARNMALLNITMMDAAIACWDAKYFYFNPRPSQVNPSIKTPTGVPNFPAYVSGHSTFSGAASTVLGHIIPSKATEFEMKAEEASISRLYGCIHYRSDCEQGLILGKKVGQIAVARAIIDGAE